MSQRHGMAPLTRLMAIGILFTIHTGTSRTVSVPSADKVRLEQLKSVPSGWTRSRSKDSVPESTPIFLRIALHQPNVEQFEQTLLDTSTPSNPRYGQHLTRDAVKILLRPTDAAVSAVLGWLYEEGISSSSIVHDNDWIYVNLTLGQANNLLDTAFAAYTHITSGAEIIRTLEYSIPSSLQGHIDMIQPTTRFGPIRSQQKSLIHGWKIGHKADGASQWRGDGAYFDYSTCNTTELKGNGTIVPGLPYVTVECIRHLYSFGDPDQPAVIAKTSKLAIGGFLNQFPKYNALETFLNEYAPYAVGKNFSVTSIAGGGNNQTDPQNPDDDLEGNLDIQYGLSLAYPTPVNYFSTGNTADYVAFLTEPNPPELYPENDPNLSFLQYLRELPDSDLPQTLSISYGEDELDVPESYQISVCNQFAQLAARGMSVLVASGDSGPGSYCETSDGSNTTRFRSNYPSTCPFVTSVGATLGVFPEQAVFLSSGGFSDRYPTPAYQREAVKAYLDMLGPTQWQGLYNAQGRAVPDVSAQGYHLHLIDTGKEFVVSGTSASAPIFAAVVALLNNVRLQNNQPSLGFLNPWLYSTGREALTDIVYGGSRGCTGNDTGTPGASPDIPYASWNATPGWDPVTGLGTPNVQKLKQLVLRLPGSKAY